MGTLSRRAAITPVVLPTENVEWRPQCYDFTEGNAAELNATVLELLNARQKQLPNIDDFYYFLGASTYRLLAVSFTIPKVIHQVWIGEKQPPAALLDTWRNGYVKACKGWQHKLWGATDVLQLRYLSTHYLDKESTLNGKSDWLRSAIMYEHGGVYIDADTQWVNNKCLDDIMMLASTTGFITALEPGKNHAAPGVMGAVKHHPLLKLMMGMQIALSSAPRISAGAAWERVGPGAITAALAASDNNRLSRSCVKSRDNLMEEQYFNDKDPAIDALIAVVLKSRYFYPSSWIHHNFTHIKNLTYVAELTQRQYPDAIMYQLGMSTHLGEVKGR